MRKVVLLIVTIAAASYLVLWAGSAITRRVLIAGNEHSWPLGLGTLAEVPDRYPRRDMSGGAARLIALARPLGIDHAPRARAEGMAGTGGPMSFVRGQLGDWVTAELLRPSPAIETMPSESGEYLAAHAGDLAAARTLLLSNEEVVWPQNVEDPTTPLPASLGHLQLANVFTGSALDRARVGDAGSWSDLHAAWRVAQILGARPDVTSNIVSLEIARRVNAAARKMPLPAPRWLDEMMSFDFRRQQIAAYQAAAWSIADRVEAETGIDGEPLARRTVDALMSPYTRMSAADMAEGWREQSVALASSRACNVDRAAPDDFAWWNFPAREISTPNLQSMWGRLFRFTAEREATARALRLRAGQPPLPASSCAGGRWVYDADGFRYDGPVWQPEVQRSAIPLEFALR